MSTCAQQQQRQRLAAWLLFLLLPAATSYAQFLPFDCQGAGPAATVTANVTTGNSSNRSRSSRVDPFFRQPYALVAPGAYYINRTRPVPALRESFGAAAAGGFGSSISRGRSGSTAGAAASREAGDAVHTAAVCPMDSAFQRRAFSMTSCRLFVRTTILNDNNKPLIYYCSAWFISPQHVATAGHCISEGPDYIVDRQLPGFVCCRFGADGNCLPRYRYRLQAWVTTQGFLSNSPSRSNDGAVIKIVPQSPKNFVPPVPQTSFGAFQGSKPPEAGIFMDGYPMQTLEDGCGEVDEVKRYQTMASRPAQPINSRTQNATAVQYQMSGCAGMSGGRVLSRGPTGSAFGLQTFGYEWCQGPEGRGRGTTGVTFVSDFTSDTCGVCLKCLMEAVP